MTDEEHTEMIEAGHMLRYDGRDREWISIDSWKDKESVPIYWWNTHYFLDYLAYWSSGLELTKDKCTNIIPLGLLPLKEQQSIKKAYKKDPVSVEMYWGGQLWRPHNMRTDGIFLNEQQPYRLGGKNDN